jgi:hypothetical protein
MQLQMEGLGNEFLAFTSGYVQTLWLAQYGRTDFDRNDFGDDGTATPAFYIGHLVHFQYRNGNHGFAGEHEYA